MRKGGTNASGDLRADGGLARSEYAMQLQADILGLPVRRAEIENLTPFGAGLLAGLGVGLWNNLEALAAVDRPSTTYQPRPETFDSWTRRYHDWCGAVDATLTWKQQQGGSQ